MLWVGVSLCIICEDVCARVPMDLYVLCVCESRGLGVFVPSLMC